MRERGRGGGGGGEIRREKKRERRRSPPDPHRYGHGFIPIITRINTDCIDRRIDRCDAGEVEYTTRREADLTVFLLKKGPKFFSQGFIRKFCEV